MKTRMGTAAGIWIPGLVFALLTASARAEMSDADLRTRFPEITAVEHKTVGEGESKSADVLAQWAAARDEAVKGCEGKTYTSVDFTLRPEPGSEIRCRILLPPADAWDGRLWGVGNSGWAGCLPARLWRYPAAGTAVVTTDLGTGRITNDGRTNVEAWPACVKRDYDWRATHLMTGFGTRLCEAFYGKRPHHRYFCGGSCGGRQALSEAIRFPYDYNGIIANLPANSGVCKEAAMFHLRKVTHDETTGALLFTTNEMRIVADAACELKGVKVLDDPRFSEEEIDAFLRLAARKAPRLGAPDLQRRLKSLYLPVVVDGKCVFNGFAPGTYHGKNMQWTKFLRFANFLKERGYATAADYSNGTWEQFLEFARAEGGEFNACTADLSEFRRAGGKLLMTAGLEDQTIPPYLILEHYDRVCAADGGIANTRDYFSLWCLPCCAHGGGKGRLMTCPPNTMRIHDQLVGWCERGERPTDVYPGWEYGDGTHPCGGFARIDPSFTATTIPVFDHEDLNRGVPLPATVTVDFGAAVGPIKPMNAVNNGPELSRGRRENMSTYEAANIPFARLHDSSEYVVYGGEHTVDVSAVFPDFDADENDPNNYDFTVTDNYLRRIRAVGTEPFYRLGQRIEHAAKRYNVYPPKDSAKWARICEHIIRHCNEGWADGFFCGIRYWEIWNEPDIDRRRDDLPCLWGGTPEQFFAFYAVAAKHLKAKFPGLKIGGPALAGALDWGEQFLRYQHEHGTPMDFFSWHCYARTPEQMVGTAKTVRDLMAQYGYGEKESVLNEWNYMKDWRNGYYYSARKIGEQKGAAFAAAAMIACQKAPVDMLMYYNAQPTVVFNGLFDGVGLQPLKGYYAMYSWGKLLSYGTETAATSDAADVFAVAARDADGRRAVFLARYSDDDNESAQKEITVRLSHGTFPARVFAHQTDETRMQTEVPLKADGGELRLILPPQSFALIEF